MVKKIKKYLKFTLCCALIMSLVAPTYAALSASDGSAFVTKAEFDAALADFNARLTTFESGINSKIDSQVTSYLDRNGIWNGKKQTLESVNGWPRGIYTWEFFDQINIVGNGTGRVDETTANNWGDVVAGGTTVFGSGQARGGTFIYNVAADGKTAWYGYTSPDLATVGSTFKSLLMSKGMKPAKNTPVITRSSKSGLLLLSFCKTQYANMNGADWKRGFFDYSFDVDAWSDEERGCSSWYQFHKALTNAGIVADDFVDTISLSDYHTIPNDKGWQALYSILPAHVGNRWFLPTVSLDMFFCVNGVIRESLNLFSWQPARQGGPMVLDVGNDEKTWLEPAAFASEPSTIVKQFFVGNGDEVEIVVSLVAGGRGSNNYGWYYNSDQCFAGIGLQILDAQVY